MKLLVDQNVPHGLVKGLRAGGHNTEHTRDLGLSRATDVDLIALARQEDRVVITYDGDFAQLIALSGSSRPSVVHLRLGDLSVAEVQTLILRVLAETERALDAGSIVSLRREGYRLHPLPIERW